MAIVTYYIVCCYGIFDALRYYFQRMQIATFFKGSCIKLPR